MNVQPEITYRSVEKTDALDELVNSKIAKLERFCDHISSCRVAIEKAHDHPSSGSPYRVRLDITVPPSHELAVDRSPDSGTQYEPVDAVIRHAFDAMERQLNELIERQKHYGVGHGAWGMGHGALFAGRYFYQSLTL